MAPEAMTLSANGSPSKYFRSTAKGFRGDGYIQSLTISAMMSHSLVSDDNTRCSCLSATHFDTHNYLTIIIIPRMHMYWI